MILYNVLLKQLWLQCKIPLQQTFLQKSSSGRSLPAYEALLL